MRLISTRIMSVIRPPAVHWTAGTSILFETTLSHCGKFDYFTRVIQVEIRRIGSICRQVARQFSQNDFTIHHRTERLLIPVRQARTIRSRRASSGSPRHRRRPMSEQRNTAPSSKADERAAEHRANVEGRRASSGSLRHRQLERNDSGLQSIERHQSIISSPIIISCLCLHRDHHYSHCGSRVSININGD